jgi:3-isopropylmalate dehydratase small subunit
MPEPFRTFSGVAVPMLENDINTDQMAPVQNARGLNPDHAAMFFSRRRFKADGGEDPDFVLNMPRFRGGGILVAGNNFGCGSSREGAVWAMAAFGFRCVVARSFADIFRENCLKNGVLTVTLPDDRAAEFEALVVTNDGAAPFTADLENQRIVAPDGTEFPFEIGQSERIALLEGLDDIGMTLKHLDDIRAWESRAAGARPWLQRAADRRLG